jgi:hypothetical protein
MENLFFQFNQNNSGGYFVYDDKVGISEYVIVEAKNALDAWETLNKILDSSTENAWSYCSCCGERGYDVNDDSDGTNQPCIYDEPIEFAKQGLFRYSAHVHYLDGTFKKFDLKE